MEVKSESEVAQSSPTLSDPMDCSSPGSSVHGIFQARVLEWGAIAFSGIYITHTHIYDTCNLFSVFYLTRFPSFLLLFQKSSFCLDFSQNCIFLFHIINSWSYFNYLISPSFMLYFSKKKNALIDIVVELLSHVQLFATPWTVAHQTPLFSTVSGK